MTRIRSLAVLVSGMAASTLLACNYDFGMPADAGVSTDPAHTRDAGRASTPERDASGPYPNGDAGVLARPDAAAPPTPHPCTNAEDCPAADELPAGCAEAACEAGGCTYRALDRDADGVRAAGCRSARVAIETGDDCDDANASIAPATAERCNGQDDDCDTRVDEDVAPFDELPDCSAGRGVCARQGKPTCVAGQPTGCSAVPGPPDGPDAPSCDGRDHDCNGVADEGCACVAGQTRDCVQRCGRYTERCSDGAWPTCDPNGGTAPTTYCYDADGDGFLSSSAVCREFCPAGSAGWGESLNGDPGWRTPPPASQPSDCDDGNGRRFPGNPDASCDGTDQDCSGGEPDVRCGSCGQVPCGGTCPACPAGFADQGRAFCEARSAWGAEVAFGDGVTGPAPEVPWETPYGNPANGHVEVHLQYSGPCCARDDLTTAVLRCSNGHSHAFRSRDYADQATGEVVSYYVDVAPGTQCYLDRISNRKSACIGHCIRRHWVNIWSNAPSCL